MDVETGLCLLLLVVLVGEVRSGFRGIIMLLESNQSNVEKKSGEWFAFLWSGRSPTPPHTLSDTLQCSLRCAKICVEKETLSTVFLL